MGRSARTRGRALFSIHDIAPSTLAAVAAVLPEVRRAGVAAANLAVVPKYRGTEDWADGAALRRAVESGGPDMRAEILQHGYEHIRTGSNTRLTRTRGIRSRLQSAGEDEFYRLDPREAERRIVAGRDIIEAAFGRKPRVFLPPAWAGARDLRGLLRDRGFTATEDHVWIHDLRTGRKAFSPVIAFATRSRWRERLSLGWARAVKALAASAAILRFAVHPADLDSPAVRTLAFELLAELAPSREWGLYEDLFGPGESRPGTSARSTSGPVGGSPRTARS